MPSFIEWFVSSLRPYVRARFGRTERGATLVEYLLLLTLIAVVCIVSVAWFGDTNSSKLSNVASRVG